MIVPSGARWRFFDGRVLARVLVAVIAAVQPVNGQGSPPRVVVGPNTLVTDDSAHPYIEPFLALNPVDTAHLLAVSSRADTSWYGVVALTSFDGGVTWRESRLSACDLDAWAAFLSTGEPLVSCLARGDGPTSILVFRSDDGGRGWNRPAEVPRRRSSFDHPIDGG